MKGRTPTKAERDYMDATCQLGCIVCLLEFEMYSPCAPHHIDGKTRPEAHMRTIPLCHAHHQSGIDCADYVSRHPFKARFEARYGSEEYLLQKTKELLGVE